MKTALGLMLAPLLLSLAGPALAQPRKPPPPPETPTDSTAPVPPAPPGRRLHPLPVTDPVARGEEHTGEHGRRDAQRHDLPRFEPNLDLVLHALEVSHDSLTCIHV